MTGQPSAFTAAPSDKRYEQLRQELTALRESMEQIAETVYSPDNLVAATIDARGELTDLVLDPRIYRTTDAKALAHTIATTIREATAAVTQRMMELTEPMLPEGMRRDAKGEIDLDAIFGRVSGKTGDR